MSGFAWLAYIKDRNVMCYLGDIGEAEGECCVCVGGGVGVVRCGGGGKG